MTSGHWRGQQGVIAGGELPFHTSINFLPVLNNFLSPPPQQQPPLLLFHNYIHPTAARLPFLTHPHARWHISQQQQHYLRPASCILGKSLLSIPLPHLPGHWDRKLDNTPSPSRVRAEWVPTKGHANALDELPGLWTKVVRSRVCRTEHPLAAESKVLLWPVVTP